MMSFAIAAYVLLRSIQKQRRGWRIAKILLKGTKLAGFWLLGAGMSAVLFYPLLLLQCWEVREWEQIWKQLTVFRAKLAAELEEAGKFRFDTADLGFEGVKANSAMQYGTNGTSFYYSVTNPATSRYLCDNKMNISYNMYVRHF